MAATAGIALHRLLRQSEVHTLLASFATLDPALGLAVVSADRRRLATVGSWPRDTLAETLTAVGDLASSPDGARPVDTNTHRYYPLSAGAWIVGALVARGGPPGGHVCEPLLHEALSILIGQRLEQRETANEVLACYREINLLYRVGETIGRSLDPQAIPALMLQESRLIKADAGMVMLGDIAARFGAAGEVAALHDALHGIHDSLLESGRPAIMTDLRGGGARWSSVLWAPLRTTERVLGGIALGRRAGQPIFVANDEKLLMALAAPSALTLENAQLFADLQRTLNETLEMKNLMDDVFTSIASGVLTTDRMHQVALCNPAAAQILGLHRDLVIGTRLEDALPEPLARLAAIAAATVDREAVTLGEELSSTLPERGPLHLYLSCTPIRSAARGSNGAAIVINDMTEQRRVEAERDRIRQTFGRVVAPRVRDRLLSDASHLRLDGDRHTITVLFADLHNFTSFSERIEPETLFKVLNSYLSLAAQAVLEEEGTLDKFLGDAVMAFWNAPDAQPDHALRAVRAALAMRRALETHRGAMEERFQLHFSVGITTGAAIVGNVGTSELFNYTAIGDTVNLAQRLEDAAYPGHILLSEATYLQVVDRVTATPLAPMFVKGRQEPARAFELKGLKH
jgi:PAS domain S-box-containing protein